MSRNRIRQACGKTADLPFFFLKNPYRRALNRYY
jgi:hypothetical protein